jgi:hypothetical protein
MSVIHNERVKLTATWLNTLTSATATVGVLAPLASIVYGLGPLHPSLVALVPAMAIWFFAATRLTFRGKAHARGLKQ